MEFKLKKTPKAIRRQFDKVWSCGIMGWQRNQ